MSNSTVNDKDERLRLAVDANIKIQTIRRHAAGIHESTTRDPKTVLSETAKIQLLPETNIQLLNIGFSLMLEMKF